MKKHIHFLAGLSCILVISNLIGCQDSGANPKTAINGAGLTPGKLPVTSAVDLGVVFQGESARLNTWVKNQGDRVIRVNKLERSCDCLIVNFFKTEIAPGDRVLVQFHYDGSKEPDFIGGLMIEVAMMDDKDVKVGQIEVSLDVIRPLPRPEQEGKPVDQESQPQSQ